MAKKSLTIVNGATHHWNQGTMRMTKAWQAAKGIKLLGGWLGNLPDLNPIKKLWSQAFAAGRMRNFDQARQGDKKNCSKSWATGHTRVPEIPLPEHTEMNASCH